MCYRHGDSNSNKVLHPPQRYHYLHRSEISKKLITGTSRPLSNVKLVHAVRSDFDKLRTIMQVEICWVGGHIGLPGNDTADALAEMGSARSTKEGGFDFTSQALDSDKIFEKLLGNNFTRLNRSF